MTTVFGEILENGTMRLDVTTGYGAINPSTGNPIANKTILQVDCYLSIDPSKTRDNPQPNNPAQLWAEGYVTRVFDTANPLVDLEARMPVGIPNGIPIEISATPGRIYLERVPIPAEILEFDCLDIIGEPICGWFEPGRY